MHGLPAADGDISTELTHPFRDRQAKPGSTASDNSDLVLEQRRREHCRQITGGAVPMSTGAKIIDMKNRSSWVTIVALAIAAAGLACQPNEPAESIPATPPPP